MQLKLCPFCASKFAEMLDKPKFAPRIIRLWLDEDGVLHPLL